MPSHLFGQGLLLRIFLMSWVISHTAKICGIASNHNERDERFFKRLPHRHAPQRTKWTFFLRHGDPKEHSRCWVTIDAEYEDSVVSQHAKVLFWIKPVAEQLSLTYNHNVDFCPIRCDGVWTFPIALFKILHTSQSFCSWNCCATLSPANAERVIHRIKPVVFVA